MVAWTVEIITRGEDNRPATILRERLVGENLRRAPLSRELLL
jgi:hypothetical protein